MQHYLVNDMQGLASQRWQDAFPDGVSVNLSGLQDQLDAHCAADHLIWLHTTNTRWHDFLALILQRWPGERVVLLTSMPEDDEGLNAICQGVKGYVHDYARPELLQGVALAVIHGGLWVGPPLMQRLISATHAALSPHLSRSKKSEVNPVWACLTEREARVVSAVTDGRSNKEVADLLYISERTVKAHLGSVFEKLGVRDRLQLVLHVSNSGLKNQAI
jgi:DNA-binding NarL/FixJ family response regulator